VMEAFPAISLLMAAALVQAGLGSLGLWLMAVIGLVLGIGAPLAIVSGAFTISKKLAAAGGASGAVALVIGGAALTLGAAYGLTLLRRGRNESALASAVAGALVAVFLAGTVGGATWSRMQAARPFCKTMDAALPKGERIAVEGTKFEQFMFYTLRDTADFDSDAALIDILEGGRCRYAILLRARYERMRGAPPVQGLSLLAEAPISDKDYVLIGPAQP
jgi:hypothetical protein